MFDSKQSDCMISEDLIREKILGEVIEPNFTYKFGYIARGLSECYISCDFMNTLGYNKISLMEGCELWSVSY